MNLVIDIGNTRTKAAIFDKEEMMHYFICDKLSVKILKEQIANFPTIKNVAVSSVAHIGKRVEKYLQKNYFYINLNHLTPIPIKNKYKTPKTLGKDRLSAIIGAFSLFPKKNCLVIDAGTCIKYDVLFEKAYLGGNIAPGIEMRLQAMHHFTARLPKIEQKPLKDIIGNNTETALRSGAQTGALMEVKGYIAACRKKYGSLKVLLTGGDADYFVKNLKTKIFVHPNLVLVGLNKILNYNAQKSK